MNIISEIQRFNGDKRLNKLNFLYERNSFLESLLCMPPTTVP